MDFILDLVVHRIGVYVLGLLSGPFQGREWFCLGLGSRRRRPDSTFSIRSFHNLAHLHPWPLI